MDSVNDHDSSHAEAPRKARKLFLGLGIALLLAAGAMAFGWWYFLIPLRHQLSDEWRRTHSDQELWVEIQKRVHRMGWMHDDFGEVGMRGGKEWAHWVILHYEPNGEPQDCSTGHKDSAMAYLTNQMAGPTAKDWADWWERNKDKSQEEWIRDGFTSRGIQLHAPMDKSDLCRLLGVLGEPNEELKHCRYNAARLIAANELLRDLDPNEIPAESLPAVCLGLAKYASYSHAFGGADTPANFDLGRTPRYEMDYTILQPKVTYGAYGTMAGLGVVGAALVVLYLVRRKRLQLQRAPGANADPG